MILCYTTKDRTSFKVGLARHVLHDFGHETSFETGGMFSGQGVKSIKRVMRVICRKPYVITHSLIAQNENVLLSLILGTQRRSI